MKVSLSILVLLFSLNYSSGQKILEIPKNDVVEEFLKILPKYLEAYNLEKLEESSDSLTIRIWKSHEIFTLRVRDSISSTYKIHIANDRPILASLDFPEKISRIILDSLLSNRIMDLNDEKFRGIDGSFILIEVSTKLNIK